jgi:hypothetical protein
LSRGCDRAPQRRHHLISFGDFAGAHDHYQRALELYDQARHADFANRFGQDPVPRQKPMLLSRCWGLVNGQYLGNYLNGVTITGGTGGFEGAQGVLYSIFGAIDLNKGQLTLRYEGTVCFERVPPP